MYRNQTKDRPLHELLFEHGEVQFLSSIHATEEEDDFRSLAEKGDRVLGSRNRWAILAMDGNDMGSQFREFQKSEDLHTPSGRQRLNRWMTVMSRELDTCTRRAFLDGLETVLAKWAKWWETEERDLTERAKNRSPIVLPFRPLIVGGDDVLCLCHVSIAMRLAEEIIRRFETLSVAAAQRASKEDGIPSLWPATGNRLTISAGIVYSRVTLPLFNAIPYAESLLGSAKGKFREKRRPGQPTPAAIDWESVTETMLDTPTARRKREMQFHDPDLNRKIFLCKRPCLATEIPELRRKAHELREVPRSVLAETQKILSLPWSRRSQRLAALRKRQQEFVDRVQDFDFDGQDPPGEFWVEEDGKRTCMFADILSLLEEESDVAEHRVNRVIHGTERFSDRGLPSFRKKSDTEGIVRDEDRIHTGNSFGR
ncbi:MAG: hypothetical protein Q4C47_07295 [Planctomycetia bacterium]|nr:hypothetical protein [Planctomycetia bacterium]